jgi:Zinc binding domain
VTDCCQTLSPSDIADVCPECRNRGKGVSIVTLKALLQPSALQTIQPEVTYSFCSTSSCDVVYFNASQRYREDTLKVPVYQKNEAQDVPVCYCFGWTRERLTQAAKVGVHPIDHIRQQVQSNRCGCEFNNPQGACCLGNVSTFAQNLGRDEG